MKIINMTKGARKIVEECVGVKKGENVLIVTDTGRDFSIAEILASAVEAAGAHFSIIITKPLANPGDEPDPIVAKAMIAADAVIAPTTRTIFHTSATREACRAGTRVFTLSEAIPDTLISGLIEVDFTKQKPLVDALAERMAKGNIIEIKAPGGTDLRAKISGRKPEPSSGICHKSGERMGATIEVYVAPIEDCVDGTFVCDASSSVIGLVKEPIKIEFKKGKAVKIEGGSEAKQLREHLESIGDDKVYTIAEIAFGLNPKARIVGNIIEDEGKYGTGHIALGNNVGFGGTNDVNLHIDMVYWKPSVWIDGEQIFMEGELLIK